MRTRLILAAILGLQLVSSLIFFRGYVGGDDYPYTVLAAEWVTDTGIEYQGFAPYFFVRVGILAPMAALFGLFGISEVTALVPMALYALGGTAALFWLGRNLLGESGGLVAAAVFASVPFTLRSASLVLADGPVVSTTILGLAALVSASTSRALESMARRSLLLGLAALAFGAAWLTKASVFAMAPVVAVLLLRHLRRSPTAIRDAATFLAIAASVLLAEGWFYWRTEGDWLYRRTAVEATNARFAHLWDDILTPRRFLFDGPRAMISPVIFGIVPVLAFGIAVVALVRRRHLALVAWIAYLVLFFNFMTTSFAHYQPLRPVSIYFYLLLVPMALLIAAFLDRELPSLLAAADRRWRAATVRWPPTKHWGSMMRWHRPLVALTLAGTVAATVLVEARNRSLNSSHLRTVLATLRAQPESTAVYLEGPRHWWGCRLLAGPGDAERCRRYDAGDPHVKARAGDLVASIGKADPEAALAPFALIAEPLIVDPDRWLVLYRLAPSPGTDPKSGLSR